MTDTCSLRNSLLIVRDPESNNLIPFSQMGVKGLTTFLKENRRKLSSTHEFRSNGGTSSENVKVIVDGWS